MPASMALLHCYNVLRGALRDYHAASDAALWAQIYDPIT